MGDAGDDAVVIESRLEIVTFLLLPSGIAVTCANRVADWLYDPIAAVIAPLITSIERGPDLLVTLLAGDYGLVTMFPFLLLYALPTIVVFSVILAVYKSTGLIDRISVALHPWLRPFGVGGRDLVRVVMGFGCKDGIAIGLLDSDWGAVKIGLETPAQVLTVVYLAGVLLPCLVTLFTIGREMHWRFAAKLCLRQIARASGFAFVIARLGARL